MPIANARSKGAPNPMPMPIASFEVSVLLATDDVVSGKLEVGEGPIPGPVVAVGDGTVVAAPRETVDEGADVVVAIFT